MAGMPRPTRGEVHTIFDSRVIYVSCVYCGFLAQTERGLATHLAGEKYCTVVQSQLALESRGLVMLRPYAGSATVLWSGLGGEHPLGRVLFCAPGIVRSASGLRRSPGLRTQKRSLRQSETTCLYGPAWLYGWLKVAQSLSDAAQAVLINDPERRAAVLAYLNLCRSTPGPNPFDSGAISVSELETLLLRSVYED